MNSNQIGLLLAQPYYMVLLEEQDALITINSDDTYMTVYNPNEDLLRRLQQLASANGLFIWQP